jgi:hypothetical protein
MLTILLSWVVNGSIVLPEHLEIRGIGVNSIVQISKTSQPFVIESYVNKHGDNDPIVPPN